MILNELSNWKGAVEINGQKFDSIENAQKYVTANNVVIDTLTLISNTNQSSRRVLASEGDAVQYKITVRQYMTKPATPDFDFMLKWNNNIPMPLTTMVGTILDETPGMYKMSLHGDIISECMDKCLRCGRPITNPVSRYFGMGPECGAHNYTNPFNTTAELQAAVDKYRREYLQKIVWTGWVIKSAIISMEKYETI